MATIRNTSDFRSIMRQRLSRIRRAAHQGLEEVGDLIADEVQKLAPTDHGDLADSIVAHPVEERGDHLSVEVVIGEGLDRDYVASVEYGNSQQQGQPFIRPGFRRAKDRAGALIADRIRDSF